jgi:DNA-binding SARP family transcriptional activator
LHERRALRSELAGILWPDTREEVALARLRTALWRLEQLEPNVVSTNGTSITLIPTVEIDLDDLELVARTALACGPTASRSEVDRLSSAGDLLPELSDDWMMVARERWRLLRLHALESIVERLAALGQFGLAIDLAAAVLADDPLRETAHRLSIECHLAIGNRSEAIRTFIAYRERMATDLALEPSTDIVQLLDVGLGQGARKAVTMAEPALTRLSGR